MGSLRSTREVVVWAEVVDELSRRIDAAIACAATAMDLRTMGFAQGQLAAYREMLQLPKTMLTAEELDEADKKNRDAIQRSQNSQNWKHPDLGR